MILRPGAPPPMIVVYCQLCELPVERFAVVGGRERHDSLVLSEPLSSYAFEVEAQCCGQTQGKRIGLDEYLRAKATGQKIFVRTKKGRFQGLGALRRADARGKGP